MYRIKRKGCESNVEEWMRVRKQIVKVKLEEGKKKQEQNAIKLQHDNVRKVFGGN